MIKELFRGILFEICNPRTSEGAVRSLVSANGFITEKHKRAEFNADAAAHFDEHPQTREIKSVRRLAEVETANVTATEVNAIMHRYWSVISAAAGVADVPLILHFPLMLELGVTAPSSPGSMLFNPQSATPFTDRTIADLRLRELGLTGEIDTEEKTVVFGITHELRHNQQIFAGRMAPTERADAIFWDGERVTIERPSVARGVGLSSYSDYPWERDANVAAIKAVQEIWS